MENISTRKRLVLSVFITALSFSAALFANSALQIDTILTDDYAQGAPGAVKEVFSKSTPVIYIIWKSDQLKQGQKIKSVWIADDTNNVAPANYKIDEAEMVLADGMKGKILSHLPGTFWDGKFSITKPNNGWPIGKYHADIYVDGTLVKTVKFNVVESTAPKKAPGSWGSISADTKSNDKDRAYGVGGGDTKDEAEKNAVKFCVDAGGEQCSVIVSYQQCAAYAVSTDHQGIGTGATKQISEEMAKAQCKAPDCSIIASDCN